MYRSVSSSNTWLAPGIQLQGFLIVLDGFSQVLRLVAVRLSQLRVDTAHREVVVCAGFGVGLRGFNRGLTEQEATQGDSEQQRFGGTNHDPTLFSARRHPRGGSKTMFSLYNGV